MRKLTLMSVLLIALFALTACSDDDSNNGPGFSGPDLSGTWQGTWGGSEVLMVLDQNGADVSGTVTIGRQLMNLSGTVSATGVFTWGAVTPEETDCVSMGSSVSDFQVRKQNTEMGGVAQRRRASGSGDNPCGGRVAVESGEMQLERAF